MKHIVTFILSCFLVISTQAENILAPCFGNNMVLQQKTKVQLWGTAPAESAIIINMQGKTVKAKADKSGSWEAQISNLKSGGPYKMEVKASNNSQILDSVYVGEVWLAGGQSNMAWQLSKDLNSNQAIETANNDNIKFLMVPQKYYEGHKIKDSLMIWKDATSKNVGNMSAVAYYFAQKLQKELNVPIGVVCCYKGGTSAEAWMTYESLASNPDFRPILTRYDSILSEYGENGHEEAYDAYTDSLKAYRRAVKEGDTSINRPTEPMGPYHYKRPVGLYENMLSRVIPYTFKGTIWYQGEGNAPKAEQYQTLFPALIKLWRNDFRNPNMPFLFVQLSNYDHPKYTNPNWAELREAQLMTWQSVPNTAMAVSIDVGDKNDIHPREKQPVGERLADAALNVAYNYKIEYSGPVYDKMTKKDNSILLNFTHVGKGLTTQNNVTLAGFYICGEDKKFAPAQAEIVDGKQVKVWSDKVTNPIAVRYGWANYTDANLYNKDGFPATPFRTDNFELITKGRR